MRGHSWHASATLVLVLGLCLFLAQVTRPVEGQTTVGHDLRDVVDTEEDEDWLAWGEELDEQNRIDAASPQLVFVQLKPKAVREEKDQQKLAHKFRSWLRLGGYEESVFAVNEDRLFLSVKYSNDVGEYLELFLKHEDVKHFEMDKTIYVWDEDEERARPAGKTVDPFSSPSPKAQAPKKKKKKKKGKAKSEL
ncbi:hypothetical protein HOP50_19g84530 [Chloropicon primus]|nr:hypothetical protein HOP50_19g84530 [Chloropicon primus]